MYQNLEYARTLLLRLEHDSSSIKIQSRKAAAQTSLSAQRALIKRLTDRLRDLERIGDDEIMQYKSEQDVGEDILAEYEDAGHPHDCTSEKMTEQSLYSHFPQQPLLEPSNTIRNRRQGDATKSLSPATATGADTGDTVTGDTAKILESEDSQAADLTSSLLSLAQQLKASSKSFSASLTADTEHLNRAVDGLDKNTSGMEAAGKRMGMLKRMSEGKGWWGRMMLYAWIVGLWLTAFLLVALGPKLRF